MKLFFRRIFLNKWININKKVNIKNSILDLSHTHNYGIMNNLILEDKPANTYVYLNVYNLSRFLYSILFLYSFSITLEFS
jgi:hypothetical protein